MRTALVKYVAALSLISFAGLGISETMQLMFSLQADVSLALGLSIAATSAFYLSKNLGLEIPCIKFAVLGYLYLAISIPFETTIFRLILGFAAVAFFLVGLIKNFAIAFSATGDTTE